MQFTGVREFYIEFYRGEAAVSTYVSHGIHMPTEPTSIEQAVEAVMARRNDIAVVAANGWTVEDVEVAIGHEHWNGQRQPHIDFYVTVIV